MSDSPLGPSPPSEQVGRFNAAYEAGPPPWDIGRPQPSFLELAELGSSPDVSWMWDVALVNTHLWRPLED
jgi:hypothetical protein